MKKINLSKRFISARYFSVLWFLYFVLAKLFPRNTPPSQHTFVYVSSGSVFHGLIDTAYNNILDNRQTVFIVRDGDLWCACTFVATVWGMPFMLT